MKFSKLLTLFWILSLLLAACASPAATTAPPVVETAAPATPAVQPSSTPAEQPIYLAIIWHQHQPVYAKDPQTGLYVRPWVRVHATKDYLDMAAMLQNYPDIHVTFNLTPSLLRQLQDYSAGAKDVYWAYAEVDADQLTVEQKQFILERFFDTNRKIIARFPRYQQLLGLRDHSADALSEFSVQDFRDLQILFNLAWTDPDWLAQPPLADLVAKGRDFSEEDKQILFERQMELLNQVIPLHKALQDAGQIEITTTPFAHPILPLLVTTDLAKQALPGIELPSQPFVFGQDAQAQIALGVQLYQDLFGRPPRGMWPAEGSVAQEIVSMVAKNGITWMASDEGVLAQSLGMDSFVRNTRDVVTDADALYRPYYVQGKKGKVAMIFRDTVISDKVGFTYSGMDGKAAARDFINRIHAIQTQLQQSGAQGPHLVSVILDGENAWENYPNDGKEFLNALYQGLSEDAGIVTVTPSEFLQMAPEQPAIDQLWAGSWISHDFSTWIGEPEENTAWDLLRQTRETLQTYITGKNKGRASQDKVEQATTQMYIAEGSDWFWWYGADQDSGNDDSFDAQFRATLKQVYTILGETPPKILDVPIIPARAVSADQPATDLIAPQVDGRFSAGEWDTAGQYLAAGGVMSGGTPFFASLRYGFDTQNLYLGILPDEQAEWPAGKAKLEVYFNVPGGREFNHFSRGGTLLGFQANRMLELMLQDGQLVSAGLLTASGGEVWQASQPLEQAAQGEGFEIGLPLAMLGNADTGARISMMAVWHAPVMLNEKPVESDLAVLPSGGPAQVSVPDLGTTTLVLDVSDPQNDDYGPGSYTYPTDGVFSGGVFDILSFQVGYDAENIVFKFTVRGPVENVWNSPNGLSVQTFDIYIDQDGDGQGGSAMLPGRNLALQEGLAWDFVITAEGWTAGIFTPGDQGPQQVAESSQFQILTDPGQRKVTVQVPKAILGDTPQDWRFAAVVLSQEGYPSGGVMRVRDVLPVNEQWRIGGGPQGATNHTRVIDLVWPEAGMQEGWLSDFTPVNTPQTELTAQDFARVPMLETAPVEP